jgi:hypothetical protein
MKLQIIEGHYPFMPDKVLVVDDSRPNPQPIAYGVDKETAEIFVTMYNAIVAAYEETCESNEHYRTALEWIACHSSAHHVHQYVADFLAQEANRSD